MTPEERMSNLKRLDGEIRKEELNIIKLIKSQFTTYPQKEKELALKIIKCL